MTVTQLRDYSNPRRRLTSGLPEVLEDVPPRLLAELTGVNTPAARAWKFGWRTPQPRHAAALRRLAQLVEAATGG